MYGKRACPFEGGPADEGRAAQSTRYRMPLDGDDSVIERSRAVLRDVYCGAVRKNHWQQIAHRLDADMASGTTSAAAEYVGQQERCYFGADQCLQGSLFPRIQPYSSYNSGTMRTP